MSFAPKGPCFPENGWQPCRGPLTKSGFDYCEIYKGGLWFGLIKIGKNSRPPRCSVVSCTKMLALDDLRPISCAFGRGIVPQAQAGTCLDWDPGNFKPKQHLKTTWAMTNRARYPCKPDHSNQEVRFPRMGMHGTRGLGRKDPWHPGGALSRASLVTCRLSIMHAAAALSYQSDTTPVRGIGSNLKWIHPAVSIHSTGFTRTHLHAADSPSAQADVEQPHRDAPTLSIHCTLANAKQRVAKCPRKEPCCGCAPPPPLFSIAGL